jgi:hypothetical protein
VIRVVVDPSVFISALIGSRGSAQDVVVRAFVDERITVVATSTQSSASIATCLTPASTRRRSGRRDSSPTGSRRSSKDRSSALPRRPQADDVTVTGGRYVPVWNLCPERPRSAREETLEALWGTRTPDPFLTMEVLYRLS